MAARNPQKNEAAAARIREKLPGADLELRTLDLCSLDSVRSFAKDFLADHRRLDVLLDNAGVMCCPQGTTPDGFETHLATNHIGHFLLTGLLAPVLVASAPSRVVVLSSAAHTIAGIDFDDPMFERREYDAWLAYGQSKTANVLFALELDRRLAREGVSAYSVHPGMIMTELARHMDAELLGRFQKRAKARAQASGVGGSGMNFKPLEAGAATQVWAATTGDLADHGGAYLADCQLGLPGDDHGEQSVAPHAQDPDAAARLWTASEGWVGQTFDL